MPQLPPLIPRLTPAFEAARRDVTWNKRLDTARAPDLIAQCRSADEVAAVIRHAREQGLKVSPRGTGHHYEAAALRDHGIMIDLGSLDSVEIDRDARTARIGAGVRGGDLSAKLAEQGFAFPAGHCADVGLSGYLLAGGFGWNAGEWGAACTNVTAVELVTASGGIVMANESENANLFWAARGAGPGFFAAITAYHLRLHPLPVAYAWRATYPASSVPALADWLTKATDAAHSSVEVGSFLLANPDSGEPSLILRVSACGESEDDVLDRVSPFLSPPPDVALLSKPEGEMVPFPELPKLSPMPSGKRVAADHLWSDAPVGEMLLAIYDMPAPGPHSTVDVVGYGGHTPIRLPDEAALGVVGGAGAGIYALWDDPAEDAAHRDWVRRVDDALAPFHTCRYVGEADLTVAPGRRAECFTPAALDRLAELRRGYDPDGLFCVWP